MKLGLARIFLLGIVIIITLSVILPGIFLPTDTLHYFPSFIQANFTPVHNSLLADPIYQFEPWRYFAKEQILKGNFPSWNSLNSKGVPFFANPQTAVLFPLNFFYYLFPLKISLLLIPMLKIYLFGFFSFLYLRSLKVTSSISALSSFVIATTGYFPLWLLWPHTNVFLFLPLFLFLIEKIKFENNATHRYYVGLSVGYFFAILGGHPETLFHISLLLLCYGIFRFYKERTKLAKILVSIIFGGLLAAIVLIPFAEYLLNSYALYARTLTTTYNFLPLQSFISNFIPFILGAPHLPFYKSFSPTTNFQEYTGGYVGVIVFIIGACGFFTFRKISMISFWAIEVIIAWLAVYGIFPFSFIATVPFLHSIDNNRLIAFASFGMITLFALTINQYIQKKKVLKIVGKNLLSNLFIGSFLVACGLLFMYLHNFSVVTKTQVFGLFLIKHALLLIFTTLIFLLLFFLLIKKNKLTTKWICILFIPILFQTTIFFWNYNPITSSSDYFPKNELASRLQNLPKGTYLEVGNPSIPANMNLIYGLENAENDDALQVKSYQKAFDAAFPIKNQWKMVESVDKNNLSRFGISYVLSDYNVNFDRQNIQPAYTTILGPLTNERILTATFVAKNNNLAEVRILPANYNRRNSCSIFVTIFDQQSHIEILRKKIACSAVLDKMYYTLDVTSQLVPGEEYSIEVSSPDATLNNSIALWGNNKNQPYISLFYNTDSNKYIYLGTENRVQIWKVPGISDIALEGSYKMLDKDPQNFSFLYTAKNDTPAEIKIPYFPGWNATIDGKNAGIQNNNPFIRLFLPSGTHIVRLQYQPISFLAGKIISCIAFLLLLLFLFRNEKKQQWSKTINSLWNKKNKDFNKKNTFTFTVFLFITLLMLSLLFSGIIIVFILPKSIPIPNTSVVNWLIVHNHSIVLDYVRFLIFSLSIPIIIVCCWILIIWKRNH